MLTSHEGISMSNDPRIVGGWYHNGYWHNDYTVIAIDGEFVTKQYDNGIIRRHSTAWDASKDRQGGELCRKVACHWNVAVTLGVPHE